MPHMRPRLFGGVGGAVGGRLGWVQCAVAGWSVYLPAEVVYGVVVLPAGQHEVVESGGSAL